MFNSRRKSVTRISMFWTQAKRLYLTYVDWTKTAAVE